MDRSPAIRVSLIPYARPLIPAPPLPIPSPLLHWLFLFTAHRPLCFKSHSTQNPPLFGAHSNDSERHQRFFISREGAFFTANCARSRRQRRLIL